nr:GNAT family N-acetyltransferase [Candidatus Sigynarchaeota archaeon]
MIVLLIISVILQLIGLSFVVYSPSSLHDIEFQYSYGWHVQGISDDYYSYTEDFTANGNYIIDFSGSNATVTATVSWELKDYSAGFLVTQQSNVDHYSFVYSTVDGHYITGTDQEYDPSGMNVWFHVPGGFSKSLTTGRYMVNRTGNETLDLLDTPDYVVRGESSIWEGFLMPVKSIMVEAKGTYTRPYGDPYGNYKADYTSQYHFTPEGFLIGEIYSETDTYTYSNRQVFTLNSWLFVTKASYGRQVDVLMLFIAYWLPYLLLLVLVFPLYDTLRWRPRTVNVNGRLLKIHYSVPPEMQFKIDSAYAPVLQSYLLRARAADGFVVTASDVSGIIYGLGIVDPEDDFGTFYCPRDALEPMMNYAGVSYAFTEEYPMAKFKKIEEYDVFRIENLQGKGIAFDAGLVKPLSGVYVKPAMTMISYEDYGKANPKLSRWVEHAIKTDVAFVAVAPLQAEWVRNIMGNILQEKMRPQVIGGEVLMGIGFATPSGNCAWLYGLYVHPAFRNTGIGKTLVMARLSTLKQMGVETALTEIADWNGPARKIYTRFEPDPAGKIYFIGKKMPKVKVRRH